MTASSALEKDPPEDPVKDAAGCLVQLATMPGTVALRAFVLGKLWGWHFTGLAGPVPPFVTLFVLALLTPLFLSGTFARSRSNCSVQEAVAASVLCQLIVLGCGYLAWAMG